LVTTTKIQGKIERAYRTFLIKSSIPAIELKNCSKVNVITNRAEMLTSGVLFKDLRFLKTKMKESNVPIAKAKPNKEKSIIGLNDPFTKTSLNVEICLRILRSSKKAI
jgi:hypothetical protein